MADLWQGEGASGVRYQLPRQLLRLLRDDGDRAIPATCMRTAPTSAQRMMWA